MINLKQYISVVATQDSMIDIDRPGIVITLYGPRGGTLCVAELSFIEASNLRDRLAIAMGKLKERSD